LKTISLENTPSDVGRIPGNSAIWVGLFAELTEFGLMFFVYFVLRAHNPEAFREGVHKLSTLAGVGNTLIMITSSFFIVLAVHAIRADKTKVCFRWLTAALVTGLGYPVVKFFEVSWNFENGVTGNGDPFILAYYYLTINHLVHISWGLLGLLLVMFNTRMNAYSSKSYGGLEAFACYWHVTDLIWLIIFPLIYVF